MTKMGAGDEEARLATGQTLMFVWDLLRGPEKELISPRCTSKVHLSPR